MGLKYPVIVVGAGAMAFVNKFLDRCQRGVIRDAAKFMTKECPAGLDIVDFAEKVCEPTVMALFKEYVIDRGNFLAGARIIV